MPEEPAFFISRQDSLGIEQFSRNEVTKPIKVVAKNIPFLIEIRAASVNLFETRISAFLHYDSDYALDPSELKHVDCLKKEPMSYKTFVSGSGDKMTVEIRAFVLSSQHEDSLFRVKISIAHRSCRFDLTSDPIRVVSKPSLVCKYINQEPVMKKKRANSSSPVSASPSEVDRTPEIPVGPLSPSPNKDDMIIQALARLEQQQKVQQKMIESLIAERQASPRSDPCQWGAGLSSMVPDSSDLDFENSFRRFLQAYSQLPVTERPHKIRRVLQDSLISSTIDMAEIASVCSESLEDNSSQTSSSDNEIDFLNAPVIRDDIFQNLCPDFLSHPN